MNGVGLRTWKEPPVATLIVPFQHLAERSGERYDSVSSRQQMPGPKLESDIFRIQVQSGTGLLLLLTLS
jgi:hypothetical protein